MPSAASPAPMRRRLWLFRLAAVLLGLSVFGLAELLCVLCGWGRPTDADDPFVGFSAVHPLFVLDAETGQYQIPPSRRPYFAAESFPVVKGPTTFRAFVLGGSTVQGQPFGKPTAFTTWLELALNAADPGRDWDVINCGGVSYASYRLVPILKECLRYQPDLFILCTGHNEFLEERTYGHVKHAPTVLAMPQRWAARSRIFTLLRGTVRQLTSSAPRPAADRPQLPAEVDARLDHHGALDAYRRDEAGRAAVMAHYEHNLRRMLALARQAGVPVILVRPCSNLRDCPPFKSQHRDGLSAAELQRWESLLHAARQQYRSDVPAAVDLLRQSLEIDDRFAAVWFELGKCLETLHQHAEARQAYLHAREQDVCPLRILQPMEERLERVAAETGTPLLDAHELLEQTCADGILGDSLLVDHVHPSFRGHQMIAEALLAEMARQGWTHPAADWPTRAVAAFQTHFRSLDAMYFLRGERKLRILRAWTHGEGPEPPMVPAPDGE